MSNEEIQLIAIIVWLVGMGVTSLAHWVQRGRVPGVRLEPGHPPRLHPAGSG